MRCDQCKHWGGPDGDLLEGFGTCARTFFWARVPDDARETQTAVVADCEDYGAQLDTRADHFCAMFEALDGNRPDEWKGE